MGAILVGTCNWSDHADFYPPGLKPGDRLSYYARHFPIVEVDSTFYRIQPATYFARWADRTPRDFVFNVKAYRELTWHDREKPPEASTFETFTQTLQPLRDAGKLRAVHFQFPPWFVCTPENRDYILTAREFFPGDQLAVEFRHRSWLTPEHQEATLDLLRENRLTYVVVDEPQIGSGSVPPVVAVTNPDLAIVRFHGRNRATWYKKGPTSGDRFDYLYSREELSEWLPSLRQMAEQTKETHLLMNNNRANYAVVNAKDLMALLGLPGVSESPPESDSDVQPRLI